MYNILSIAQLWPEDRYISKSRTAKYKSMHVLNIGAFYHIVFQQIYANFQSHKYAQFTSVMTVPIFYLLVASTNHY